MEFESADVTGWATRNQRYKLLELSNGAQELYDLEVDLAEENNLLGTGDYGDIVRELEDYADQVRGISPTDVVDITNMTFMSRAANCEDQIARYRSSVRDVGSNTAYEGSMVITAEGGKCVFTSNAIPNHDFTDGARAFPNPVRAQTSRFEVTTQPTLANALTPLSLRTDNAVLLNGVKVDILAAGCFGVGDGRIGCNDINQSWRYDPMNASSGFNVDTHNAHTQPDGAYHYHGPPNALFEDSNASRSLVLRRTASRSLALTSSPEPRSEALGAATDCAVARARRAPAIRAGCTAAPSGTTTNTYRVSATSTNATA